MNIQALCDGRFPVDQLNTSFGFCQELTRREARNFYYGLRLTPEPKRSAMYAVYAWMRTADDLMDADDADPNKLEQIELFRNATQQALNDPTTLPAHVPTLHQAMWPAVACTFTHYNVPWKFLDQMIEGQLQDQSQMHYQTFRELHDYCYKVASVVGLVCIHIWGYEGGRETEQIAEDRGVALQLTNILRDLVEDAQRGRVYLPQEDLDRFGVTKEQILARKPSEGFDRLMAFQVERAEDFYRKSQSLEQYIDSACRPTSWAMMRIYHRLLDRIRRNPRRVLEDRVSLRKRQKMMIALHATWKRTWPLS